MFHRSLTSVLLVTLLTLLLIQPLLAGGWTVVTLQDLPMQMQAEERLDVSFLVQQHGRHPLELDDGEVIVRAWQPVSGETMQVVARATGAPGYYSAELIFPTGGVWHWEVRPGGFPAAAMPDLTVAPSAMQPSAEMYDAARQWGWWQQALFQMFSSLRRPSETATAEAGIVGAADLTKDPVAYGKALFVAKGCVTCHVHESVTAQFSVETGPNLTSYQVIPEYVSVWLRNPQSIKPDTQMPQLPLKAAEIDALIAFLSAGEHSRVGTK